MGKRTIPVIIASALTWFAPPANCAMAQSAPGTAAPAQADDSRRSLCDTPTLRAKPLTDDEAAACRALWQEDVAAARARQAAFQAQAIANRAAHNVRPKSDGPVPLSTFVGDDTLDYGDIVMIDEGPRVYVGRAYEQAKTEDFVKLDAPRSPHRKRAAEMMRALKR